METNRFQERARDEVSALVKKHGLEISFKEMGKNELYLYGILPTRAIEVWIYDDELQFNGVDILRLLEKPDHDDENEMLQYFIEELDRALEKLGSESTFQ